MKTQTESENGHPDLTLRVYLLGTVNFQEVLQLQRRLVYEVSGDRSQAALVLCQHVPVITVGRHGSRTHILCEPGELRARQWQVHWVNRGGGVFLHVPGQLVLYPILPLDQLGLTPPEYLARLHQVMQGLLADFGISTEPLPEYLGLRCDGRLIAAVGAAVRGWVTSFGGLVNVSPALEPFRLVRSDPTPARAPMTTLERERHGPVSPTLVRERLIAHFATTFGFSDTVIFTGHPQVAPTKRLGG